MKKLLKIILWTFAVTMAAALIACGALYWRYGSLGWRPVVVLPAAWSISSGWHASADSRNGVDIELKNCRLGDAGNPLAIVSSARCSGDLLEFELAEEPREYHRWALWLADLELPIAAVKISGTWGVLHGDRQSGRWRLDYRRAEGFEVRNWDAHSMEWRVRAEKLPEAWSALMNGMPWAVAPAGYSEGNAVLSLPEEKLLQLNIVNPALEFQYSPELSRLTRRHVELRQPFQATLSRLSLSGTPGEATFRADGEIQQLGGEIGAYLPTGAEPWRLTGEIRDGQWVHWEFHGDGRGGAVQKNSFQGRLDKLSGSPSGVEAHYREVAIATPWGALLAEEAAMRHDWQGPLTFTLAKAQLPPVLAGWSAPQLELVRCEVEPGSGRLMKLHADAVKWAKTMPEWDVMATDCSADFSGERPVLRAGLLSIDAIDWNGLLHDCVIMQESGWQISGERGEIACAGLWQAGAGAVEIALTERDLRVNLTSWQLNSEQWEWVQEDVAQKVPVFSGEWRDGYWSGALNLLAFRGTEKGAEADWAFHSAVLQLPCEFPLASMRPSGDAKLLADTNGFRYQGDLASGTMNLPAVLFGNTRIGAAAITWKPAATAGTWEGDGRLQLSVLGDSELYFQRRLGRWQWLLPVANWPAEPQLSSVLNAWSGITLSGMIGLNGEAEQPNVEFRGGTLAVGKWRLENVQGNLPLRRLASWELREDATLQFGTLGEWQAGNVTLKNADAPWLVTSLKAAWCGGEVELTSPVLPHGDPVLWAMKLHRVHVGALLRYLGLQSATAQIPLVGNAEWSWSALAGAWRLNGAVLQGKDLGVVALPEVGAQMPQGSDSNAFFRALLEKMDCREMTVTLLPDGENAWLVTIGVTAKPVEALPFVLSGLPEDPFVRAKPGEPGFSGEIDFEVNLKIR